VAAKRGRLQTPGGGNAKRGFLAGSEAPWGRLRLGKEKRGRRAHRGDEEDVREVVTSSLMAHRRRKPGSAYYQREGKKSVGLF